jgi:hypothetical protein
MIKLKNILSEAYAWERQDGKPLPTLKDVQEAYDAKGVEEAEDKADKDYESALNMRSLGESFWGRVKGNLHGHEYILREAFRK